MLRHPAVKKAPKCQRYTYIKAAPERFFSGALYLNTAVLRLIALYSRAAQEGKNISPGYQIMHAAFSFFCSLLPLAAWVLWLAHMNVLFARDSFSRRVNAVPVQTLYRICLAALFLASFFIGYEPRHHSSPALKL